MANFELAYQYMIQHELGWLDDPSDSGGATMNGIAFKLAQQFGITSKSELHNISEELQIQIYHDTFWKFDNITSDKVAAKIFDFYVNAGSYAIKLIQQICVSEYDFVINIDGHFGPHTTDAVNQCDEKDFLRKCQDYYSEYYWSITEDWVRYHAQMAGWPQQNIQDCLTAIENKDALATRKIAELTHMQFMVLPGKPRYIVGWLKRAMSLP